MKRIKQFERTDRDITNALLLLLEKNRFEKITVAQIIEEAGINRSTFYQHFSDKYEIVERLQTKYLDEFVAVAESVGAMDNPDLNDDAIALQAYFQKNRSILKKIFSIQSSILSCSSTWALAIVAIPMMAFMGVRISWLMRARKSDLAWLACSADFSASLSCFDCFSSFFCNSLCSVMSVILM